MDRDRLERLCRELRSKLSDVSGLAIEWIGDSNAELPLPRSVWRQFTGIDHWPTVQIKTSTPEPELIEALHSCVLELKSPSRLLLSVGGYGALWAVVNVLDSARLVQGLWSSLENHELVVVSAEHDRGFAITEEEYEYYLYKFSVQHDEEPFGLVIDS